MTCARRGVSLEQRTHGTVMFQSFFCYLARRSQRLRTLLIARCPQLRSEAQACCVRYGRLAPCPVLRLQLRNPGLTGLLCGRTVISTAQEVADDIRTKRTAWAISSA